MRKRSSLVKVGRLGAGTGLLLGYVRVSRGADQTNAMRVKSLSSAGCRRIFEEVSPGGRWDRPETLPLREDPACGRVFTQNSMLRAPLAGAPTYSARPRRSHFHMVVTSYALRILGWFPTS